MKRLAGLTLLAGAIVISGLAFSQDPPAPETTEQKVERLEKELVASKERTETVAAHLVKTQKLLDATVKYLAAQAESSKGMTRVLDESEAAGFTWGINPESRKILLSGWREHLAALQKDIPQDAATAADAKPAGANAKSARPSPRR